jgi:hypothetical protein
LLKNRVNKSPEQNQYGNSDKNSSGSGEVSAFAMLIQVDTAIIAAELEIADEFLTFTQYAF